VENDPFWAYYDETRLARALERLEFLLVLTMCRRRPLKGLMWCSHCAGIRAHGLRFCQSGGPGPGSLAGAWRGTPLALISPDVHPPRTWLDHVPGSDPGPRRRFSGVDPGPVRTGRPRPRRPVGLAGPAKSLFAPMRFLAEHPEGCGCCRRRARSAILPLPRRRPPHRPPTRWNSCWWTDLRHRRTGELLALMREWKPSRCF